MLILTCAPWARSPPSRPAPSYLLPPPSSPALPPPLPAPAPPSPLASPAAPWPCARRSWRHLARRRRGARPRCGRLRLRRLRLDGEALEEIPIAHLMRALREVEEERVAIRLGRPIHIQDRQDRTELHNRHHAVTVHVRPRKDAGELMRLPGHDLTHCRLRRRLRRQPRGNLRLVNTRGGLRDRRVETIAHRLQLQC